MAKHLYTMAQARRDLAMGYLTSARILRSQDGWVVELGGGKALGELADARRKQRRVFKSLDGAAGALEQIGFVVKDLQPVG